VLELARAIERSMATDLDSAARARLASRTQAEFGIEVGLRRWNSVLSAAMAGRKKGKRNRSSER
jgi:hypothetical protein